MGTKFSGFGTYHFWLVLFLSSVVLRLSTMILSTRFEDATADADRGEDEIVPEDEDSNSSSEYDMEIVQFSL